MHNTVLSKRHESEREFHDKKYQKKKSTIYDYGFTDIIVNDMLNMIGDLHKKKVLDFGCGSGWLTKLLLKKGAQVYAFDISLEAVKLTIKEAESINKADMLVADTMPAEHLSYPDNFFDMVIGIAILHHLDIRLAVEEIHRVLKPDAVSYFMEPLADNPFISLYRKITPDIRSRDEQPLRPSDFKIIEEIFANFRHEEYYLLVLLSLFWFYGINNQKMLLFFRDMFHRFDTALLKKNQHLKKFCWYSILMMQK